MDYVKKSIEKRALHKMEHDSRVNERLMQTTEEKTDTSNALDALDATILSNPPNSLMKERCQNAEQCHEICPLPAKLTDDKTTELSNQSLESENVCLKKTVAQCQQDFAKLEAHCINLELQMQNNVLKSGQQSQFLKEKRHEFSDQRPEDSLNGTTNKKSNENAVVLSSDIEKRKDNSPLAQQRLKVEPQWFNMQISLTNVKANKSLNVKHPSDTNVFTMKMEILLEPASNKLLVGSYTDAKDIWENVKMILEGSELTKDDWESQLYDDFEHFYGHAQDAAQHKVCDNMLPEWSRFITEVKLNRGLKESNFDQLYAYLKQHEVHANENRTMMERFLQPTNDPLALVSNASVQQYPTQSSKSPQPSNEPSPADKFQLDSGSSSTENLI
ncbi:hypothetical protein Tco_1275697 [Tanacetum coccineum]